MLYILSVIVFSLPTLNTQLGSDTTLDPERVQSLMPKDVFAKTQAIKTAMDLNNEVSQDDVDKITQEEQDKVDKLVESMEPEESSTFSEQSEPEEKPVGFKALFGGHSSSLTTSLITSIVCILSINL